MFCIVFNAFFAYLVWRYRCEFSILKTLNRDRGVGLWYILIGVVFFNDTSPSNTLDNALIIWKHGEDSPSKKERLKSLVQVVCVRPIHCP